MIFDTVTRPHLPKKQPPQRDGFGRKHALQVGIPAFQAPPPIPTFIDTSVDFPAIKTLLSQRFGDCPTHYFKDLSHHVKYNHNTARPYQDGAERLATMPGLPIAASIRNMIQCSHENKVATATADDESSLLSRRMVALMRAPVGDPLLPADVNDAIKKVAAGESLGDNVAVLPDWCASTEAAPDLLRISRQALVRLCHAIEIGNSAEADLYGTIAVELYSSLERNRRSIRSGGGWSDADTFEYLLREDGERFEACPAGVAWIVERWWKAQRVDEYFRASPFERMIAGDPQGFAAWCAREIGEDQKDRDHCLDVILKIPRPIHSTDLALRLIELTRAISEKLTARSAEALARVSFDCNDPRWLALEEDSYQRILESPQTVDETALLILLNTDMLQLWKKKAVAEPAELPRLLSNLQEIGLGKGAYAGLAQQVHRKFFTCGLDETIFLMTGGSHSTALYYSRDVIMEKTNDELLYGAASTAIAAAHDDPVAEAARALFSSRLNRYWDQSSIFGNCWFEDRGHHLALAGVPSRFPPGVFGTIMQRLPVTALETCDHTPLIGPGGNDYSFLECPEASMLKLVRAGSNGTCGASDPLAAAIARHPHVQPEELHISEISPATIQRLLAAGSLDKLSGISYYVVSNQEDAAARFILAIERNWERLESLALDGAPYGSSRRGIYARGRYPSLRSLEERTKAQYFDPGYSRSEVTAIIAACPRIRHLGLPKVTTRAARVLGSALGPQLEKLKLGSANWPVLRELATSSMPALRALEISINLSDKKEWFLPRGMNRIESLNAFLSGDWAPRLSSVSLVLYQDFSAAESDAIVSSKMLRRADHVALTWSVRSKPGPVILERLVANGALVNASVIDLQMAALRRNDLALLLRSPLRANAVIRLPRNIKHEDMSALLDDPSCRRGFDTAVLALNSWPYTKEFEALTGRARLLI